MSSTATGLVFDIRRFSVHDGPGLRTTVFFKGCPLRCLWCHNPESQHRRPERLFWADRCLACQSCISACPEGAIQWDGQHPVVDAAKCNLSGACVAACYAEARQIAGRRMSVAEVMAEVERDISFYEGSQAQGGVTFSGGEPLLQPDFLLGLLRACKDQDLHTALDTSGYAAWETVDRIRSMVDLFLYDLKLMDPRRHREYTLAHNTRILENLRRLALLGHNITVRVPVIPGVNDDPQNLEATGAFVAELGGSGRVDLLPYHHAAMSKYERLHRSYRLPWLATPSDERMAEIARVFEGHGLDVHVGG
ncbi:MAG TPA: glycyl-radical enzyme activating protein [Anaerolineales bacterium]|nr:glycyl-radical enzyme activating protein [Anaerolineales bacterium]